MPDLPLLTWAVLAVGALLVGISKTALPGAATISVALFATVLPARESTGALLLLLILGDVFALRAYRTFADWQSLRRLVPPVLLGVVAGTAFLAVAGDAVVRRTIGGIVLGLVLVTLTTRWLRARPGGAPEAGPGAAPAGSVRPRRAQTGFYGALGGFTTMVANAGGPVMSLYFLASRFSISAFLGTAAWFFAAVNVAKVPFSVSLGLIDVGTLLMDLALAPAVVLGAAIGLRTARRFTQQVFDRLVLALTVGSAVYLLV